MQFVLTTYGISLLTIGAPATLTYKVGTGTGYVATASSTNLSGSVLASGVTSSIETSGIGPTYLVIVNANPSQSPTAPPVGELGLFYSGQLVALGVFDSTFNLSKVSTSTFSCALPNPGVNSSFSVLSSSQLGGLALVPNVDVLPQASTSGGNGQFAIHGASVVAYADNNSWQLTGSAYLIGKFPVTVSTTATLSLSVDLTAYSPTNKYYVTVITGNNSGLARTATLGIPLNPLSATLNFSLTWAKPFAVGDLVYLYSESTKSSASGSGVTNSVLLTGDQTVGGVKSFTSSPTVPTPLSTDNSNNIASTAFVKSLIPNVNLSSLTDTITQTAHGFTVGLWVYYDGTNTKYALADALTEATSEAVGVVSYVIDANTFVITTSGFYQGVNPEFTPGKVYKLSAGPPSGKLQSGVDLQVGTLVDKPVFVALTNISGYVMIMRGTLLPGTLANGTNSSIIVGSLTPVILPAPMTTVSQAFTTYDYGSSAHHNLNYRNTGSGNLTVTVRPDSFFTGTDEYWANKYNPANPGPMPVGGSSIFGMLGLGTITFVAGAGVTINTPASLVLSTRFGKVTLVKAAANVWDLEGHLA